VNSMRVASNQRETTPRTNNRTRDRREILRRDGFGRVAGFSVTFQE
jgi:hypothetical protein